MYVVARRSKWDVIREGFNLQHGRYYKYKLRAALGGTYLVWKHYAASFNPFLLTKTPHKFPVFPSWLLVSKTAENQRYSTPPHEVGKSDPVDTTYWYNIARAIWMLVQVSREHSARFQLVQAFLPGSYVTLYISYDTRNVNSVSYDMDSRNSLSQWMIKGPSIDFEGGTVWHMI